MLGTIIAQQRESFGGKEMKLIDHAIATIAVLAPISLHATPITLSQTAVIPEIQAREFLVGTEVEFNFPKWSSIELIEFTFATIDQDFNLGVGPTGGDSGVEIAVLSEGSTPTRVGIASVIPGNQVVSLRPGSGDPLGRPELVASQLLDGLLTASLGSFENFPGCCSFGFQLDQASFLNVAVTGELVEVPEPATLTLFGIGLVGLGIARRRFKAL